MCPQGSAPPNNPCGAFPAGALTTPNFANRALAHPRALANAWPWLLSVSCEPCACLSEPMWQWTAPRTGPCTRACNWLGLVQNARNAHASFA